MEVSTLIYFVSLVRNHSVHDAAMELNVSPTTINHAVYALEQSAGVPLLLRNAHGREAVPVTTAYGESFHRTSVLFLQSCLSLISPAERGGEVSAQLSEQDLHTIRQSGITFRMISYFLRVCDAGSISAAAKGLAVTQPALSRQIGKFETVLGFQLFERTHTGMQLTAAARPLKDICQTMALLFDRLRRSLSLGYSRAVKDLKFAAMIPSSSKSALASLLAGLIPLWHNRAYQPSLSITTIVVPAIVAGLLDKTYDVGLADVIDVPATLDFLDFETSPIFLVFGKTDQKLSLDDHPESIIAASTMALPSLGTGMRSLTDAYLESAAVRPRAVLETQSMSLMLRLVEDNICCAILPAGAFEYHNVFSKQLPRRFARTTRLLWRRDYRNMDVIGRLTSALQEVRSGSRCC
ncbi:LysR family transcriptional regulator [Acetobacter okinawensis]|nr:LysR family transcriptional regulator [Acetobacter okinawensis]